MLDTSFRNRVNRCRLPVYQRFFKEMDSHIRVLLAVISDITDQKVVPPPLLHHSNVFPVPRLDPFKVKSRTVSRRIVNQEYPRFITAVVMRPKPPGING